MNAQIQMQLNAGSAVAGWRQDAVVADVVSLSLTSATGVSSYLWQLVGRPEGSTAGGPGPEPLTLSTSATASFTADLGGTYDIQCVVNAGGPSQKVLTAGCAILETILDPAGRPLRLIGPTEDAEDTHEPLVRQGWVKILNRWLRLLAAGSGSTTSQVAGWDPTLIRYFFLDGDNGNDSNIGYMDAGAGDTINPAGRAWKTCGKFMANLPRIGAGRSWVLLIAARAGGAVYDHATPGDGLGTFDLSAISGYAYQLVRGSSGLSNSSDDKQNLGFVKKFGPWSVDEVNPWSLSDNFKAVRGTLAVGGVDLPSDNLQTVLSATCGTRASFFTSPSDQNWHSQLLAYNDNEDSEFVLVCDDPGSPAANVQLDGPGVRIYAYRECASTMARPNDDQPRPSCGLVGVEVTGYPSSHFNVLGTSGTGIAQYSGVYFSCSGEHAYGLTFACGDGIVVNSSWFDETGGNDNDCSLGMGTAQLCRHEVAPKFVDLTCFKYAGTSGSPLTNEITARESIHMTKCMLSSAQVAFMDADFGSGVAPQVFFDRVIYQQLMLSGVKQFRSKDCVMFHANDDFNDGVAIGPDLIPGALFSFENLNNNGTSGINNSAISVYRDAAVLAPITLRLSGTNNLDNNNTGNALCFPEIELCVSLDAINTSGFETPTGVRVLSDQNSLCPKGQLFTNGEAQRLRVGEIVRMTSEDTNQTVGRAASDSSDTAGIIGVALTDGSVGLILLVGNDPIMAVACENTFDWNAQLWLDVAAQGGLAADGQAGAYPVSLGYGIAGPVSHAVPAGANQQNPYWTQVMAWRPDPRPASM